eukprot:4283100-Prymnesium_polylepis.1
MQACSLGSSKAPRNLTCSTSPSETVAPPTTPAGMCGGGGRVPRLGFPSRSRTYLFGAEIVDARYGCATDLLLLDEEADAERVVRVHPQRQLLGHRKGLDVGRRERLE